MHSNLYELDKAIEHHVTCSQRFDMQTIDLQDQARELIGMDRRYKLRQVNVSYKNARQHQKWANDLRQLLANNE